MPPVGRKVTPLFDLLSRGSSTGIGLPTVGQPRTGPDAVPPAPSPLGKPIVRVELKPQPAPQRDPELIPPAPQPTFAPPPQRAFEPPPTPEFTGESFWTGLLSGRVVHIPALALYIAASAGVLIAVLAWFGGYKLGQVRAEDRLKGFLRQPAPAVQEPLAARNPAPTNTPPKPAPSTATQTPPVQLSRPSQPVNQPPATGEYAGLPQNAQYSVQPIQGGFMTSSGWLAADPRVVGLNYLPMGVFTAADSAEAMAFFRQQGLQAFAMPMDRATGRGNNQGPAFRLFALPGLTTEQYKAGLSRTTIETAVARAGEAWRALGKTSSFQIGNWEKFKGD